MLPNTKGYGRIREIVEEATGMVEVILHSFENMLSS